MALLIIDQILSLGYSDVAWMLAYRQVCILVLTLSELLI